MIDSVISAASVVDSLSDPRSLRGDRFAISADVDPMDEQAFQALYRQAARPLWAYISRALGDRTHADDVLQEAFLRLLRSKPASTDPGELRAILYRIASNLMMDHFRRAKRERAAAERAAPDAGSPPDAALRMDMERMFRQLRPQERAMMWLAYVEGSDHREIAEAVGVKEKSVRVLLFRARRRLAALLEAGGVRRTDPGALRRGEPSVLRHGER
jgi:RNA polymerase sigma-70 factor (ECF subfamily)